MPSILYLFAHQDDEILILAKLLADVRGGAAVRAVWITDGGKGGDPAKREAESREVMRRAGLPNDRLHFLHFPDTKSVQHLKAIDEQCAAIAAIDPPAEIVSPAFEGGNMDHDVAALIAARLTERMVPRPPTANAETPAVMKAASSAPAVMTTASSAAAAESNRASDTEASAASPVHYEYPLYNRQQRRRRISRFLPITGAGPVITLPLGAETRAVMKQAAKIYRTQRLALWALSVFGQPKKLLDRGLIYRRAPKYDFLTRPSGEPCDYKKYWTHPGKWDDWTTAVRELSQ